jgi:hypothetical protein
VDAGCWTTEKEIQVTQTSERFRASVSPAIIAKSDRLFDNTLATVLNELIQNARRAGATKLDIVTESVDGKTLVTMHDNGPGVDDPRKLLTLGLSGWDSKIADNEDPAGMGFFSLAHSGCVVESRNWSMGLTQEHFTGAEDITVTYGMDTLEGMRISFTREEATYNVRSAVKNAARYCPLQMTYGGEDLEQQNFLEDAITVKKFKGLEIGICEGKYARGGDCVNFFGIITSGGLPRVDNVDLWALINVTDENTKLRLKLPDRSTVIENDFWQEVQQETKRLIFQVLMANRGGVHQMRYNDYLAAKAFGIPMPEARKHLEGVDSFSNYARATAKDIEDVDPTPILDGTRYIIVSSSTYEYFAHTLPLLPELSSENLCLVLSKSNLSGYSWYDSLPHVTTIRVSDGDDNQLAIRSKDMKYDYDGPEIVDNLVLEIYVSDKDDPYRFALPAFIPKVYDPDIDSTPFAVSQQFIDSYGGIIPDDIEEMMIRAYWQHNDSWSADTYSTQKEQFTSKFKPRLMSIFLGEEAAALEQLFEHLNNSDFLRCYSQLGKPAIQISPNGDDKPHINIATPC